MGLLMEIFSPSKDTVGVFEIAFMVAIFVGCASAWLWPYSFPLQWDLMVGHWWTLVQDMTEMARRRELYEAWAMWWMLAQIVLTAAGVWFFAKIQRAK